MSHHPRPLCPHCFREACPWLGAYRGRHVSSCEQVPASACPGHAIPLSPSARKRAQAALKRVQITNCMASPDEDPGHTVPTMTRPTETTEPRKSDADHAVATVLRVLDLEPDTLKLSPKGLDYHRNNHAGELSILLDTDNCHELVLAFALLAVELRK